MLSYQRGLLPSPPYPDNLLIRFSSAVIRFVIAVSRRMTLVVSSCLRFFLPFIGSDIIISCQWRIINMFNKNIFADGKFI